MELKPINLNLESFPIELHPIIKESKIFDSSSSPEAKVYFIDKDGGFYLKSGEKNSLAKEVAMTNYFHSLNMSTEVLDYISSDNDWMLTKKIRGEDCISAKYLDNPLKLCDTIAERLSLLHSLTFENCPEQNYTENYLRLVRQNFKSGEYDKSQFPDSWGYRSAEDAIAVVENKSHLLKADTLIHGDYCLPNILLDNWKFSGFIDLGNAGVGDRHIDLFWGAWTLFFNLKTDIYRERFFDAYGKEKIDDEILSVIAAAEVFG